MCVCVCVRTCECSHCLISGLFDPVQIFKSVVSETKLITACLIQSDTFKTTLRPDPLARLSRGGPAQECPPCVSADRGALCLEKCGFPSEPVLHATPPSSAATTLQMNCIHDPFKRQKA